MDQIIFIFGLVIKIGFMTQIPAHKNKKLSIDSRLQNLLFIIIIEEKVNQLN